MNDPSSIVHRPSSTEQERFSASTVTAPILIVGSRRSGTTLLRTMLSRHPELLVHPAEPQFILDLYRRFGRCVHDVSKAADYVRDHPHRALTIEPSALDRIYGDCKRLSLQEFVQRYMFVWGDRDLRRKRLVLKDPYFILNLDLVLELFPGATFIHIVRDPRANVSSQRARWPQASLWECIRWWCDAARTGHQLARQNPERCIEIRFEDLIRTPEQALGQLCDFLHIPFVPQLLEFELETISFIPDKEPEPVRFTRLDPARLTHWQKYLSPLEVRLIEAGCHREMLWYQYETTKPPVTVVAFVIRFLHEWVSYQILASARQGRNALRQMMHFLFHQVYCRNR